MKLISRPELVKKENVLLESGNKYSGYGYYDNGFIPCGSGKIFYNGFYIWGTIINGEINGPAIKSFNYSMTAGIWKNNKLNGWGICLNRGFLEQFGYYRNGELYNDLHVFVKWYFHLLETSGRGDENNLSMYTTKDTKEIAEMLIGYRATGHKSQMGFRFKPDGSLWVGTTDGMDLSGYLIHFCPNGTIELGNFIEGKLIKRVPIQEFAQMMYMMHGRFQDFPQDLPEIVEHKNYFNQQNLPQLNQKFTMRYFVDQVAFYAAPELTPFPKETWSFGSCMISTPYGNLKICDAKDYKSDKYDFVGLQLDIAGKLRLNDFRYYYGNETTPEISTIWLVRHPNNAWLYCYAFGTNGLNIVTFCGMDADDDFAYYHSKMKRLYSKY